MAYLPNFLSLDLLFGLDTLGLELRPPDPNTFLTALVTLLLVLDDLEPEEPLELLLLPLDPPLLLPPPPPLLGDLLERISTSQLETSSSSRDSSVTTLRASFKWSIVVSKASSDDEEQNSKIEEHSRKEAVLMQSKDSGFRGICDVHNLNWFETSCTENSSQPETCDKVQYKTVVSNKFLIVFNTNLLCY